MINFIIDITIIFIFYYRYYLLLYYHNYYYYYYYSANTNPSPKITFICAFIPPNHVVQLKEFDEML